MAFGMKAGHERPINASAARVVSSGENFEYRPLASEICSDLPLPLIDLPETFEDLTGFKLGRLTVVGFFSIKKNRWACRCVCGRYCVRLARAIKNPAPDAACAQCYLQAVSKRHEFLRRTGKEKPTRDFL
jgi:hypothetical protein